MRLISICSIVLIVSFFTIPSANAQIPNASIERFDKDLDLIIKKEAKVEVIADGFEWVEGPLWVESQKMLLISDIFKNKVYKWTPQKGKEVYLDSSGYTQVIPRTEELGSNGLALNEKGQLLLCQHGDRRIALMNTSLDQPKAKFVTLAGQFEGKKFNSPNDLVIKRNGDIYFTDPPYGFEKGVNDPARELQFHGVYKVAKDGKVTLLVDTLTRPNGIAFFPGEKSILIGNSDPDKPYWYIYDLDNKGNLTNGRIFSDLKRPAKKENGGPDGIKIDSKGNVFGPGPGGIWVLNKNGKPLGRIKVTGRTSNCALANNDKTLFITADDYLLKVDL